MDLEARVVIRRNSETVWKRLWDVEGLARCFDGCREVGVIEPNKRYSARVVERVGPFSVSLGMELDVVESEEGRRIAIEARGVDGKLGTRIRWRADVGLEDDGEDQTAMDIRLHAEVRGKIASLGEGMVKRKAREALAKFTSSFAQMVEKG